MAGPARLYRRGAALTHAKLYKYSFVLVLILVLLVSNMSVYCFFAAVVILAILNNGSTGKSCSKLNGLAVCQCVCMHVNVCVCVFLFCARLCACVCVCGVCVLRACCMHACGAPRDV